MSVQKSLRSSSLTDEIIGVMKLLSFSNFASVWLLYVSIYICFAVQWKGASTKFKNIFETKNRVLQICKVWYETMFCDLCQTHLQPTLYVLLQTNWTRFSKNIRKTWKTNFVWVSSLGSYVVVLWFVLIAMRPGVADPCLDKVKCDPGFVYIFEPDFV